MDKRIKIQCKMSCSIHAGNFLKRDESWNWNNFGDTTFHLWLEKKNEYCTIYHTCTLSSASQSQLIVQNYVYNFCYTILSKEGTVPNTQARVFRRECVLSLRSSKIIIKWTVRFISGQHIEKNRRFTISHAESTRRLFEWPFGRPFRQRADKRI